MNTSWQNYEEVAKFLLNQFAIEFGLDKVEGKQLIPGNRSGTQWEIDAKGFKQNNEGFIIVECRRYTKSKQNQEKLASLAYRIIDTRAVGGIIVSPLGVQEGAALVAKTENIQVVHLNENCTKREFVLRFLNLIMIGVESRIGISAIVGADLIKKS